MKAFTETFAGQTDSSFEDPWSCEGYSVNTPAFYDRGGSFTPNSETPCTPPSTQEIMEDSPCDRPLWSMAHKGESSADSAPPLLDTNMLCDFVYDGPFAGNWGTFQPTQSVHPSQLMQPAQPSMQSTQQWPATFQFPQPAQFLSPTTGLSGQMALPEPVLSAQSMQLTESMQSHQSSQSMHSHHSMPSNHSNASNPSTHSSPSLEPLQPVQPMDVNQSMQTMQAWSDGVSPSDDLLQTLQLLQSPQLMQSSHLVSAPRPKQPTRCHRRGPSAASVASAASIQHLDMEKAKIETGISADAIEKYIAGPDQVTNKFTCAFSGCNKEFGRKENLKCHIQTHLNDRQYQCPHCTGRFVRQHDLRRHVKTHTQLKPYVCDCSQAFTRQDALTRHQQRQLCIGAKDGIVRTPAKRGRPRKPRP
ncbi:hypothetical protein N3K66_003804 [Trichothecium roseum]|uniref:Uncharacterized protein n=1 Tax=Trichothecium roseum TaxID=47278 RepID=A0ACC0V941_9HYPO|nr:hypothetical protein N3K66_003804 [Trichothecium roseum]